MIDVVEREIDEWDGEDEGWLWQNDKGWLEECLEYTWLVEWDLVWV